MAPVDLVIARVAHDQGTGADDVADPDRDEGGDRCIQPHEGVIADTHRFAEGRGGDPAMVADPGVEGDPRFAPDHGILADLDERVDLGLLHDHRVGPDPEAVGDDRGGADEAGEPVAPGLGLGDLGGADAIDLSDPQRDEHLVAIGRERPVDLLERDDRSSLEGRLVEKGAVDREGRDRSVAVAREVIVRDLGEGPGAEDDELSHD
jgi:hypothetical protein